MGFFGSYGKQKFKDAGDMVIKALVSFDPEGATEAEINEMSEKLEDISTRAAKARQIMLKEKQEAEHFVALHNERVTAAEILKGTMEAATDPGQKASLEKSLTTLLDTLEKMVPEIEREKQEAVDAEEFFKYLEQVTIDSAEKLKKARGEYRDAVRAMERAKMQEQIAREKESATKLASGVSQGNFSTALGAIKNITDEANARGEAARKRSDLLKPVSVEEDANISAALNEAKGTVRPTNLSERLSALKKM
jgi:hypothetical protein